MTEGELWTQEVLAELKASGFRPQAWVRFIAQSLSFARERRRDRPLEHRATVVLGGLGLAAWVAVAATGRPWLAAAGALWWVLATLMLDWHLGMLETQDGRRVDGLGPANMLTFLRAGTPPAVFALFATSAGIGLLAAAGLSDVLDGWLARRRGETTRLGRWLDGSVDGLVIGAAALGSLQTGRAPAWLIALILVRYAAPWILVATMTFAHAKTPDPARLVSGRLPGLVLFVGLLLLSLDVGAGITVSALGAVGGLATLAATLVFSFRPAVAARARFHGRSKRYSA